MSDFKAPVQQAVFSMVDVLDAPAHYHDLAPQLGLDEPTLRSLLEAVGHFAESELAPLNASGDLQGACWDAGSVRAPKGFAQAYRKFAEAGWPGLAQPVGYGGQGLPYSVSLAAMEILQAANASWCMYALLNEGAIKTLLAGARPALIDLFVPRLVSGEWTSTMCLTEAHAGSDLGLLHTRAEPVGDPAEGRFRITGNKIFISSGDHDLADNIVHLVLARLPGAPSGVRGISLFVVPKRQVLIQDAPGAPNGVSCLSVEHKMGLRGSATCTMAFDGAQGWLVGEPNRGLASMFVFINKSRLGVALQAVAQVQAAHDTCLRYAKERLQGRATPALRPDLTADPLVAHPDVRRMLLTQKAVVEGGRSLVQWCGQWVDVAELSSDPARRAEAQRMLGLLTPIAKAFLSELGFEAVDLAIQVLGGHGYMHEWGVEQRVRDARIARIYEGTSAIQGMDLLARKVLADPPGFEMLLQTIGRWCAQDVGDAWTQQLLASVQEWRGVTTEIAHQAKTQPDLVAAVALDYLMIGGYVMLGWMLVRRCRAAPADLGLAATADFYFQILLPRMQMHSKVVSTGCTSTRNIDWLAQA